MSDPVSAAKSAREALARALGAIQSDPNVPQTIMGIAEPISSAMGALFQIEKSGGAAAPAQAPGALESTRRALALLQQQPSNLPAVQHAIEAVAGSLGFLNSLASPQAPPRAAPPAPPAPPRAAPAPQHAAPQHAAPPAPPAAHRPQPPAAQPYAATYVAEPPPQHAAPSPYQATVMADVPPGGYAATQQAAAPAVAPGGATSRVDAELGAHSPSNFYKGLAGNDVVEHGGIFIATYKIPKIGQSITVHVSMPGGYEFDAVAVVRWTRETVDSSHGQAAPPGYGAQFTQIAPEARQLIYRYVRNREPLFHDDL